MEATLAALLVRYRYLVAIFSFVGIVLLTAGAEKLYFESTYKIFFEDDFPPLVAHEKMQAEYTKQDNAFFILDPAGGKVFVPEVLHIVREMTEELWLMPHSVRVDSIANFQHTVPQGDDLNVGDLVPDPDTLDAADLQRIQAIAVNEPSLVNRLISREGHVTGINVNLEMPAAFAEQDLVTKEVVEWSRALRDKYEAKYPGLKIHLLGQVFVNTAFNESSVYDMTHLGPLMFGIVIILLALFLRSVMATIAALIVIVTSIAVTMGFAGWAGYALNQINVSVPTIILTLAICDAVHILVIYLRNLGTGMDRQQAMRESLSINLQPVFLTSLTTAIGFLSMNTSDVPPFRGMGNIAAFGVMAAMVISLGLLPALMSVLPARPRAAAPETDRSGMMDRIADMIIARHTPIFWGMLVVVVVVASFIPRNEMNDDTVEYFDQSTEFRQAADFAQDNLTGFDVISYSLDSGTENGIYDPDYLKKVEAFAEWFRGMDTTTQVMTFTDVVKRLNRDMHGGDPAYYRIPDDRELIAQYVLLYELSLPMGLDLNTLVNFDKSGLRLSAIAKGLNSQKLVALEEQGRDWLRQNAPELETTGSSVSMMFAHVGKTNTESMLEGAAIAVVLIAITLIVALRSVKFGLLSLVPNAFPALLAFGFWGMFVAEVNLAVAAVFSISIGIIVDDTVHFFSKYLRARRIAGKSTEDAIRYAFHTVGGPLVVTTIALTIGFLVLAQSNFDVNASLGMMVAMVIGIALVFDLLFLPALLMRVDRHQDMRKRAT